MDALFTLVRQLANREHVTAVSAPKWLVQRHRLAAMAGRAGASAHRDDFVRATVEWSRIEAELPEIVDHIVDSGSAVAPIKGVAYAKSIYAVPGERAMSDVDLLVPRASYTRAQRALAELGFVQGVSPVLHHAQAWIRGDVVVDLHHNIIAPGRSRVDLDAVWSRTTPGWPARARNLDATDALIFHLVNMTRDRLRGPLVQVVDAARLLEAAGDERNVLDRARTWKLGASATMALRFFHGVLAGRDERPAGWLGPSRDDVVSLTEPSPVRKLLFDVAVAGSPSQLAVRAMHFGANRLRSRLHRR